MRIQHNISALNSLNNYNGNNNKLSGNLEKLSSGYRINSAADDAAGLAISEKMRSQIAGLEKAQDNANDGISLIQTAEGALTEVNSMLTRLTELATQSANGTYEDGVDRKNIQEETDAILKEIDRISSSTNYNGINLLDGSLGSTGASKVAVDVKYDKLAENADLLTLNSATAAKSEIGVTGATSMAANTEYTVSLTYSDADGNLQKKDVNFKATSAAKMTNSANADAAKKAIQEAFGDGYTVSIDSTGKLSVESNNKGASDKLEIFSVSTKEKATGTAAQVFGTDKPANTKGQDAFYTLDATKLKSYDGKGDADVFEINGQKFAFVQDADAAKKLDSDVTYVKTAAATATTAEVADMIDLINEKTGIGAVVNTGTSIDLKAGEKAGTTGEGLVLQVGDTNEKFQKVTVSIDDMSSKGLGLSGLDLSTQETAGKAITTIKSAVNSVSLQRGQLGALQNRLDHTLNNLEATTKNITASESQIRDVDMAKEMTQYSKNNILVQAAQSMLAQANSMPQGVLQLLQ